jgi:large subunit ribosomal protein L35
MPKMKTKRGAAKRFKLTAGGRVKRRKAYHTHILTKKDTKRKRNLRQATMASAADEGRVKRMLPNG